ncbi:hypothetical protein CK203_077358 [Vitis vinifera]|uniref:Uncharacterized protein n=1 Tax=Vitis vinifera TaxID=29760 RepID=A0A438EX42_VITVI|nr:hypothetical protein CK203_077358 [Vitis vinifera]
MQMGPLVRQVMPIVEASPTYSLAQNASVFDILSSEKNLDVSCPLFVTWLVNSYVYFSNTPTCHGYEYILDAWKGLLDMAGTMILDNDQETLVSLTNFVDQLPSVMNQVTQGISEFRPTPSENRECFKNSYNVQRTLLVKFNFDAIDETDLLEEILKPRVESIGGTLEKVSLNGNHITPCIQEPKWQVGNLYTPADAIAQGLKTLSLSETRVLSRTITNWFRVLKTYSTSGYPVVSAAAPRNLAYNPG